MKIFIDESGNFTIPDNRDKPSIGLIGALLVPEATCAEFFDEILSISRNWPKEKNEIKGRLLSEVEFDAAFNVFRRHDVMLDAVACDLALHRNAEVRRHQADQANLIENSIQPGFAEKLVENIRGLSADLRKLSVPQYLWFQNLIELIYTILHSKTVFYSLHRPEELGSFHWVIDAKDKEKSLLETVWRRTVPAALQSKSLRNPAIHLIGGNYEWFKRFLIERDSPPTHIASHVTQWAPGQKFHADNISMIMNESCVFTDSVDSLGLQLADLSVNALARALRGNLRHEGWQALASQMFRQPEGQPSVVMTSYYIGDRRWRRPPNYHTVLRQLTQRSRSII